MTNQRKERGTSNWRAPLEASLKNRYAGFFWGGRLLCNRRKKKEGGSAEKEGGNCAKVRKGPAHCLVPHKRLLSLRPGGKIFGVRRWGRGGGRGGWLGGKKGGGGGGVRKGDGGFDVDAGKRKGGATR